MDYIRVEKSKAQMLRGEMTKLRCWLTGFAAGRSGANTLAGIPGEDCLRQMIGAIDDGMKVAASKKPGVK